MASNDIAFGISNYSAKQQLDVERINRMGNYNKVKVGNKLLRDDVFLNNDFFLKGSRKPYDRDRIVKSIASKNLKDLRAISNYYYNLEGIYMRLVKYMAHFYRYDVFVTPVQYDKNVSEKKIIEGWFKACAFIENSKLKKHFGEIAVKVLKNGCYYGYRLDQSDRAFLQELPIDYCRSRYSWNGKPAVEFNVKFFDDTFADADYKMRVVKMFPQEIQKAYVSYKKGRLPKDTNSDDLGWVLLDPSKTVKFNIDNSDVPLFISVVPHLIDLQEAQDIDKQKMLQNIMKIVIQKFPLNKNDDMVFDLNEMTAFHNMAVNMLGDSVGVDVLSTLADVSVADMSDKGNMSAVDQLEKVERTVYNEAGVSQMQFNSEGSIALEKSIANDEGGLVDLIAQFEEYVENMIEPLNKMINKKLFYRVNILPTTVYNYKDMSKLYKEQTTLGFSKLLPQVALGMSQTVVMSTALFENNMLHLEDAFIPPRMSSTMSDTSAGSADDKQDVGRPELADGDKSDKTVQNIEAM